MAGNHEAPTDRKPREQRARAGEAQFIAAMASGMSVKQAASEAGVAERTAYRWVTLPEVGKQIEQARAQFIGQAVGLLSSSSRLAAARLGKLAADANPTVALGACRTILASVIPLREHAVDEQRIAELEAKLADCLAALDSVKPNTPPR